MTEVNFIDIINFMEFNKTKFFIQNITSFDPPPMLFVHTKKQKSFIKYKCGNLT